MPCLLKEAARDAPNQIALLSKEYSLTYQELDQRLEEIPFFKMFSAWRKGESYFAYNPKLPTPPPNFQGPPQSLLLYTSGSTAAPKVAILSLDNLITNAKSAIDAVDLKPQDQWKLSLPTYHVGGIGILMRCILARATIVLDDSPDITHLSYVPTQLYRATPIYKKLKCLLLGGAPISSYPEHLPIHTTYGLTEMASIVTIDGKVLPDRELQIAEDGEILVKGPSLFQGYFGEKAQMGWFHTKDLGKWVNGKLEILGRKDWMFISGGENIQPEEIEKELLTFPEVLEAAVVGVDDPEWGKRPVAALSGKPFSLEEMRSRLEKRLPKFKIPIALFFLDELPKKNNLKLNRFLVAQYIKDQLVLNTSGQKNGA